HGPCRGGAGEFRRLLLVRGRHPGGVLGRARPHHARPAGGRCGPAVPVGRVPPHPRAAREGRGLQGRAERQRRLPPPHRHGDHPGRAVLPGGGLPPRVFCQQPRTGLLPPGDPAQAGEVPPGVRQPAAHPMSIRPLLLSALTTAITLPLHAQDAPELVRNGGFEEVSKAPTTYDQISFATGWTNATLGLPEVFDPKAAAKTVGIPVNDYGRMEPQEGQRYAGFMGWKNDVRGGMSSSPYDDRFKPGWNAYSEYLRT